MACESPDSPALESDPELPCGRRARESGSIVSPILDFSSIRKLVAFSRPASSLDLKSFQEADSATQAQTLIVFVRM